MKISTLLETPDNGTYIGCHYDEDAVRLIARLAKSLDIKDFNPEKLHTTVIYSSKPGSDHPGFEKETVSGKAKLTGLEIFKSRQGTNVLVVRLDSPFLSSYHHKFMAEHNYTYDFDEYKPHVTLSYAYYGDEAPALSDEFFGKTLVINELYYEPLNLNWVNK